MKWLFLRGEWDKNNEYCALNKLDMWLELFEELVGDGQGYVWYKDNKNHGYRYSDKLMVICGKLPKVVRDSCGIVFARGGFDYYNKVLKKFKGFRVYYGAGKRTVPSKKPYADLILVDSLNQKEKVEKRLNVKSQVFAKPAASIFKPMDIPKKYDVGYVAVIPEDDRKRCKWVYKTCPADLKVLQMGNTPKKLKTPKNFTIKTVRRDKMVKLINQCKVIIVPYTGDDSGPRIIPEAMACGVPVMIMDTVNYWKEQYAGGFYCYHLKKKDFWPMVKAIVDKGSSSVMGSPEHLSLKSCASHLKGIISDKG